MLLWCVRGCQPQNILGMLHTGSRDIGFGGADWVAELGVGDDLIEVLDTGLDPVRIVAATPNPKVLEEGVGLHGRQLIVASEYEGITKKWLASKGVSVRVGAGVYHLLAVVIMRVIGLPRLRCTEDMA